MLFSPYIFAKILKNENSQIAFQRIIQNYTHVSRGEWLCPSCSDQERLPGDGGHLAISSEMALRAPVHILLVST